MINEIKKIKSNKTHIICYDKKYSNDGYINNVLTMLISTIMLNNNYYFDYVTSMK